ncbi:MAG: tRNA guanosine(34) transglycosylase Tgt [Candidatus Moranbacteria bacterium]|jgi:queuine tRNA-ribosyltransferase|nr:tRNA guanosine(34) transglycosylase Tgt [Candidatus Moranbacteria bacterium]
MNIFQEGKARIKKVKTKSGELETPFFMPDATRGFVKSLSGNDLEEAGVVPMVVNTYHLFLQPGMDLIKKSGDIHKFMNWKGPLLSDSGGYQVFSLIHKNPKMGKITDDGVEFRSPLSGKKHYITPEKAIQIQFDLGVDMMVCLDDPPPNSDTKEKIEAAVDRTLAWAERCMMEYKKQIKERKIEKENRPLIFCVIQGGEYLDLRKKCVDGLIEIGLSVKGGPVMSWDGYGFGARHIDSEGNFLAEVLKYTAGLIPENSLRFALGVGTPEDIVRCVEFGWDMFDCVIPTREARHGRIFLWKSDDLKGEFYETVNISNSKFKDDFNSIDEKCNCQLCKNHSRAYLHHIFRSGDPLAMRLISMHNLKFYMELIEKIKNNLKMSVK